MYIAKRKVSRGIASKPILMITYIRLEDCIFPGSGLIDDTEVFLKILLKLESKDIGL